jgi:flagellar biosynthesis/type III secretory pathway protein FliH
MQGFDKVCFKFEKITHREEEGRREGGKEGRREGGKEGRREGGKEGRREGGKEFLALLNHGMKLEIFKS